MNRRNFIEITIAGSVALSMQSCSRQSSGRGRKPNIICIMANDLGIGEVECYGFQNKIKTPNLSRIANEGIRFTNFYTGSPVCAPSRCILLTGRHAGHARRRATTASNKPEKKKNHVPLQVSDVTIAKVLKNTGYRTAGWGKWGLGNHGSTGTPDKQGFDYFYGYLDLLKAQNTLWKNGNFVPVEKEGKKPRHAHDAMAEDILKYIRANQEHPLFLYIAYTIPHFQSKVPEIDDLYKDQYWSNSEKIFASMITRMDKNIGEMMSLLAELTLDENTIIFFTSDNGPNKIWPNDKFVSTGNQRGKKQSLYQGGINCPMLVRWPGKITAGTVSKFRWVTYDFMETAADIAGCLAPKNDGKSILPTLLGKKQEPHEYIYWETYSDFQQAVMINHYKGIRHGTGEPIELYNLNLDREEIVDLSAHRPELVERMEKIMITEHVPDPHWPSREFQKKSHPSNTV